MQTHNWGEGLLCSGQTAYKKSSSKKSTKGGGVAVFRSNSIQEKLLKEEHQGGRGCCVQVKQHTRTAPQRRAPRGEGLLCSGQTAYKKSSSKKNTKGGGVAVFRSNSIQEKLLKEEHQGGRGCCVQVKQHTRKAPQRRTPRRPNHYTFLVVIFFSRHGLRT